jgi:hypothetical protein
MTLARVLRFVVACTIIAGCTSTSRPGDGKTESLEELGKTFESQAVCFSAWDELFVEWEREGGGFKASMLETRRQVATDTKSRLAALVRHTWAKQPVRSGALGEWPVERDEELRLIKTIGKEAESYVPASCEVPIWSTDAFARHERPVEFPPTVEWASPVSERWSRFWLFVRA